MQPRFPLYLHHQHYGTIRVHLCIPRCLSAEWWLDEPGCRVGTSCSSNSLSAEHSCRFLMVLTIHSICKEFCHQGFLPTKLVTHTRASQAVAAGHRGRGNEPNRNWSQISRRRMLHSNVYTL